MMTVKIELTTDPAPVVDNLKQSLQNRGIKRAIKTAIQPVRDAVVNNALAIQNLGYLAKSIGTKLVSYKTTTVGIVGPRSKTEYSGGVRVKGKNKGEDIVIKPSKYAHLVEKGTKRSMSSPFLKPALVTTQAKYLETVTEEIGKEIAKELAKTKK